MTNGLTHSDDVNKESVPDFGSGIDGTHLQERTITVADEKMTLAEAMHDIEVAHRELNQYRDGALVMVDSLNEAHAEAQMQGDCELADTISEMKRACFGIYLRLLRGEKELFGDRNGEYADYFNNAES